MLKPLAGLLLAGMAASAGACAQTGQPIPFNTLVTEVAAALTANRLAGVDISRAIVNGQQISIALQSAAAGGLAPANNLADLTDATVARLNLGLGSLATQAASAAALTGGTINGVAIGSTTPASGAFTTFSLSAPVSAGMFFASPTVGAGPPNFRALTSDDVTAALGSVPMVAANNLSEVTPITARANLGLGPISTLSVGAGLAVSGSNLTAAVTSVAGRTGTVALSTGDVSGLGPLATVGTGTGLTVVGGNLNAAVTSVAGRTGAVTLTTSDISGLSALIAQTAVDITGGTIDGTVIGGTTPAAGSFTTLTLSGSQLQHFVFAAPAGAAGAPAFRALAVSDITTALGFTPLNPANNLSEVSPNTARTNLGLGPVAVLGVGAGLTSTAGNLAALVTSVAGRTGDVVLATGDVSGLGSLATQAASAVAITGGTIDGAAIGVTAPAAGTFTTLAATGSVSAARVFASPAATAGAPSFRLLVGSDITGALGFTPLMPANDLSELTATAATARTNLGLGATAVLGVGTGLTASGGLLSANVTSVAGRTGVVALTTSDVAGLGPIATLNIGSGLSSAAGNLVAAVQSVMGRTGAVVLLSSDIATALGYTPVSVAANLSDVNAAASRVNLGLGALATIGAGHGVQIVGGNLAISLVSSDITGALAYTPLNPATVSGDATIDGTGVATVSKTGGVAFAASATINALNLSNATGGVLAATFGGTGLATGTSGGILAFTGATTLVSSSALTANALVLGGGAGAAPGPMASTGTTHGVLHGNAAGPPGWSAVDLSSADVTGNLPVTALAAGVGATNTTFWRGDGVWAVPPGGGGGSGSVTSVGLTMPAIYSVNNSPVTGAATIAVTANGTSGGLPYFASATTMASSAALGAGQIVLGGGPGGAPQTLSSTGTVTTVLHGGTGNPSFSPVSLAADVTGILPLSAITPIASHLVLSNITPSSAAAIGNTLTATIDAAIGSTRGALLERSAAGWAPLAPGIAGLCFLSGGAGADPSWSSCPSLVTAASGDLAGNFPSPTVIKINGTFPAASATINATDLANDVTGQLVSLAKLPNVAANVILGATVAGAPVAMPVPNCGPLGTMSFIAGGGPTCTNLAVVAISGSASDLTTGTLAAARLPICAARTVTTVGDITVTNGDCYVGIKSDTPSAAAINLPSPTLGENLYLKDEAGNASTFNLTVTPLFGLIDNASTFVMNVDGEAVHLFYNGTKWVVM